MDRVDFIRIEETSKDFIMSFALTSEEAGSLRLMRSPVFERLLPEHERGIDISMDSDDCDDGNLLLSVKWEAGRVEFQSQLRNYTLDISRLDSDEKAAAKAFLKKMAKGCIAAVRFT